MFRVNVLLWLFRYIGGYLTVIFYGEFPEKILNLTSFNKIFLWNSRLTDKGIESCISVKDFRNIRFILKNSGIKVHILKKHGLPFKIAQNHKRLGLAVGARIFTVFLSFMSGHIWIIDVKGNQRVEKEEIIAALNDIGICEGVKRNSINSKTQREKLLLKIDSLAWSSLNTEGCRLTVNVSEIKNKKPQNNLPSNLKATADGIITKINITSGNCIVKKGDTVKAGDVLVSGIIERQGGTKFVRSSGTIMATTERSITVKGNFKQKVIEENTKRKTKRVLEFFSYKMPLYLGKERKSYNSENKIKTFSLFNQKLPIRIYEKKFYFTDEYTILYDKNKLIEKLHKEIANIAKEKGIKTYNILSEEIQETKETLMLTVIITSEENIAINENLILNPTQP